MKRVLVVGVVAISVGWVLGCASPPPARPQPALFASADAALLQGCYDCLLEARASYRRLAVGPQRSPIVARVFEADLLIALREKELGLPPSDAIADARRIAAELPRDVEAARYLALVDLVPGNDLAVSRRDLDAFRTARAVALRALAGERAWLSQGTLRAPVRDYLRLALACAYPTLGEMPPPGQDAPRRAQRPASPLLGYRAEICGFGEIAVLAAVRAREPRFVATSFFIARTEMAQADHDGPGQAGAHLAEALARFPTSPAIVYLTGNYHQLVGDHAEAMRLYERVLAAQPAHNLALLGRVICLGNLGRPQGAVDAATHLLELGNGNLIDAYYWRAHNRRLLGELTEARSDISAAKELNTTPDVLSLAGIIEYEQHDLDPAEADLTAVVGAAAGDCTARWYFALVHRARKRWLASSHAFEGAMACFRDRAQGSAERLRALQARADLDPTYRANAAASFEASIEADARQQHLAALTAANDAVIGGDAASARSLVELAAEDPALADRVAKLRARLGIPQHKLEIPRSSP